MNIPFFVVIKIKLSKLTMGGGGSAASTTVTNDGLLTKA